MRECGWWWVLLAGAMLVLSACGGDDDDNDAADDDAADDSGDDVADDTADDDSGDDDYVIPPTNFVAPPWPEWVLRPWVWEGESTQESALAHVQGYLDQGIPTGAVIIDSPWETGYNTFVFNDDFPDPQAMVDQFHALGVRVFLWITPNVNVDSPNYQEGLDAGYYVNDGRTLEWWKGEGSFIDYFNPEALAWWHAQMDGALDLGIDGWKCDGSEFGLVLWGVVQTAAGPKTPKEYQDAYYRDFFEYSRQRLGPDRAITARPVDSYGLPVDFPAFAPVDVSFAGWVGDQDSDFIGLTNALRNMFSSAQYGYINYGSDIGGYRGDDLRDKTLFVRWAQMGALSPIMENGGGGEHRPWMYDEEVLAIYRDFAKLHDALVPYNYSQGAISYQLGISNFRPQGEFGDVTWLLGDDLLVAAMNSDDDARTVGFPSGLWLDFWDGTQYEGGTSPQVDVPLEKFPVFVRKGAVLPLALREGTVFADAGEDPLPLTVQVYPNPGTTGAFDVYEEHGTGARIEADYADGVTLRLSATTRAYAFRVRNVDTPVSIAINPTRDLPQASSLAALTDAETGWFYDAIARDLWIKPGSAEKGLIVEVK